jgi:hypothetical protein
MVAVRITIPPFDGQHGNRHASRARGGHRPDFRGFPQTTLRNAAPDGRRGPRDFARGV